VYDRDHTKILSAAIGTLRMKKIVILTGSELRHVFFRKHVALNENIKVVNTYCEGLNKTLETVVQKDDAPKDMRLKHLAARVRAEKDFFSTFVDQSPDRSNPISIAKGDINLPNYAQSIIDADPDLIIAYGCSIIRDPLLSAFAGRFVNVHLGLSPYYRGSGTNYWPLVNNEPEYVGATFMHIDAGIDTGEIIHQLRAIYCWGDTPSQIGNRLIVDMTHEVQRLIVNFDNVVKMPVLPAPTVARLYKKRDYTEDSVVQLYCNFDGGLIERYLSEESNRLAAVPILQNPALSVVSL